MTKEELKEIIIDYIALNCDWSETELKRWDWVIKELELENV